MKYSLKIKEYIKNNRIKEAKKKKKKMIEDGIYDKNIYLELGKCYLQKDKKKAIKVFTAAPNQYCILNTGFDTIY